MPGYESSVWLGLLGPSGMSKEKVSQLEAEIAQIAKSPQLLATWNKMGVIPVGNTSIEFAEKIRSDADKWGKLIRESGIKPE